MRVLLIRFSAIGDCVMAARAATAIRTTYPEAELTWVAESRCAPVVSSTLVADLVEVPRDRWKRRRGPATWREQVAFYVGLRRHHFDIGIDLQGHSKTALCLRLAGAKTRLAAQGTDALARRLNPIAEGRAPGEHTVEWNLRTVSQVLPITDPNRTEMPHRPAERTAVDAMVGGAGRLVTISTGAGQPDKRVPAEIWHAVAKAMLRDGWRVAFLGASSDPKVELPGSMDLVGRTSLAQTLEAVAISDLHLAGDTGTGHMAAAYGVPVVSVFGPTAPERFRPYTDRGVVLRDGKDTALVGPEAILQAAAQLTAVTR